ncbi:MAG: CDP-alcohol phosphatidyltransferase family protein [Azospirillaceae bacterium]
MAARVRGLDRRRIVVALPNLISLARLLLAPVAIWLVITDQRGAAFWIFLIAGISDGLDGFLARVCRARTELGAWLDPLADKLLLAGVFVALGLTGILDAWIVTLVVTRDVFIIGGVVLLKTMDVNAADITPTAISKVNTFFQIALVGMALGDDVFPPDLAPAIDLLVWLVAATTALSGLVYMRRASRRLHEQTRAG